MAPGDPWPAAGGLVNGAGQGPLRLHVDDLTFTGGTGANSARTSISHAQSSVVPDKPVTADFYVDTRYMKKIRNKTPSQEEIDAYAQKPWEHYDDSDGSQQHVAVSVYMSLRDDKRDEFLAHMDEKPKGKECITKEMKRIQDARRRFQAWDKKRELWDDLKGSREKWKARVKVGVDSERIRVSDFSKNIKADFARRSERLRKVRQLRKEVRGYSRGVEKVESKLKNLRWVVEHDPGSLEARDHPSKARELKIKWDEIYEQWQKKDLELREYVEKHPLPPIPEGTQVSDGANQSDWDDVVFKAMEKSVEKKRRWDKTLLERLKNPKSIPPPQRKGSSPTDEEMAEWKENLYDLTASAVYLVKKDKASHFTKHSEGHAWFKGEFPNQKIPV